jgi:hypothetical protein
MDQSMENVQKSYDEVAEEYTSCFFHELEYKPLDRALLDHLAKEVHGLGLVADLGCVGRATWPAIYTNTA